MPKKQKENFVEIVITADPKKKLTRKQAMDEAKIAAGDVFDDTKSTGGLTVLRVRGARKNCRP
jgi:hypothetical protein